MCDLTNLTGTNFTSFCDFVTNECSDTSGFIHYYNWQYCVFSSHVLPTIFMIIWLLVLLLAIAVTADSFFAPCLVVVTRIMRMSQNLAGVTLLALGNGAADVFSSLSAITGGEKPNVGLSLGSLIGAGILVNTVTAGIIMIIQPFQVTRRPVIKDLLFYLLAMIICIVVLITKNMSLGIASSLLVIYIIYVFVTGLGRYLYVKQKKSQTSCEDKENEDYYDNPESALENVINPNVFSSIQYSNNAKSENPNIRLVRLSEVAQSNPAFTISDEDKQKKISVIAEAGQTSHELKSSRFVNYDKVVKRQSSHLTKPIDKRIASLRLSDSVRSNRASSISHRPTGFLAKIIITHEYQKTITKANREFEVKLDKKLRTKSVENIESPKPIDSRVRFFSNDPAKSPISILKTPSGRGSEEIKTDNVKIDDAFEKISINSIPKYDEYSRPSTDSVLNKNISSPQENLDVKIADYDLNKDTTLPGLFIHFFLTILPIDLDNWSDFSLFEKIMAIIQSPIVFILTIAIPVVDDSTTLKGWCKILNSIHCFSAPFAWIVLLKLEAKHLGRGGFTISYLVLILGVLCGIAVFLTSQHSKPPKYHAFFAFLGFLTSIIFIYAIANEIVSILEVFGKVFSIPETILGLSVLAFANSVGDLVSNIMLAKRGFPRIAYAACVGGPLFNLLIGLGLPFVIKTVSGDIQVDVKSDTIVLVTTALLVTIINLITLPLMKFNLNKTYGIVLIIIYVVFIIMVLLFATNVINVIIP